MTKKLDTLRARCALAGIALHVSQDDRGHVMFIASRWALTRSFETMAEVDAWLVRVSGDRHANAACGVGGVISE